MEKQIEKNMFEMICHDRVTFIASFPKSIKLSLVNGFSSLRKELSHIPMPITVLFYTAVVLFYVSGALDAGNDNKEQTYLMTKLVAWISVSKLLVDYFTLMSKIG